MRKEVKMIADVENFAMRMITRRWDTGYQELLNLVNVPSLESRRLHSSMCTLYKIVHGLCFFPRTLYYRDPIFPSGPTGSFFSSNPLPAQMLTTIHLYLLL